MLRPTFGFALGAAVAWSLAAACLAGERPPTAAKNIVDTAAAADGFKTLLASAQAAGLVESLNGPGPLTVFAPTDEAFARLPAGTVESLLEPENKERLVAILRYHVAPGKVTAADCGTIAELPTLQGPAAKVRVVDGTVMIDVARVVKADIEAGNGVIHAIDAVLLPPEVKRPKARVSPPPRRPVAP